VVIGDGVLSREPSDRDETFQAWHNMCESVYGCLYYPFLSSIDLDRRCCGHVVVQCVTHLYGYRRHVHAGDPDD
jgi:hypothetical protein